MDTCGVFAGLLVISLAMSCSATVCPMSCVCTTTPDGLHKATCSSIESLYKFTLRQKHHNINILDLSHNNITKITHQLDHLTEVVTLDLSTNGFTNIYRFLQNSTKIVHINLANNRIHKLSMSVFPKSVSSLDLSNNLLSDVPSDIKYLKNLEHLEMERNPLDCTCENILARDYLTSQSILIDHVKCASPEMYRGLSWLELKRGEVCGSKKRSVGNEYLEMLMGNQQIDRTALEIGIESRMLKSMPSQAPTDLDEGLTWVAYGNTKEDDDDIAFLRAKRQASSKSDYMEGSGEIDVTTESSLTVPENLSASQLEDEQMMNAVNVTDDPLEGSGEGSGFGFFKSHLEVENDHTEDDYDEAIVLTTTEYKPLYTNPVNTFLGESGPQEDTEIPEYILPQRPSVYAGPKDWFNTTSTSSSTTEKSISEKIQIKAETADVMQTSPTTEDKPVYRTGTYVCVVIIVVLLVGLIAFAVIKGQMRKRRDRRLIRQQKRDIEKASKEMVDMNKSLLGKPAAVAHPSEKKVNGRYELVPTHETPVKKTENGNGNATNNAKQSDLNQNKSSPRDNNQNREDRPKSQVQLEEKLEAVPTSPSDTKNDADSLTSEDIFVPLNGEAPLFMSGMESDISQPLMNGDHNTDSDYLSPSREYVPVYSPDMGRVRIKMTETLKPKTPVLVTRSRSNAGDIIITPSNEGIPKSTT